MKREEPIEQCRVKREFAVQFRPATRTDEDGPYTLKSASLSSSASRSACSCRQRARRSRSLEVVGDVTINNLDSCSDHDDSESCDQQQAQGFESANRSQAQAEEGPEGSIAGSGRDRGQRRRRGGFCPRPQDRAKV